jgi:hypothetical protein
MIIRLRKLTVLSDYLTFWFIQITKDLILLDTSNEYKEGVKRVQKILDIPNKTDDLTSVLQAISFLISEKLNQTSIISATKTSSIKEVV